MQPKPRSCSCAAHALTEPLHRSILHIKVNDCRLLSNFTSYPKLSQPFTLSMCGCQYSSWSVLAAVPLILEKNVGLVRYINVGSKPNVSAIIAWILLRTSLYRERRGIKRRQTLHVKCKDLIQLPEEYDLRVPH